MASFKIEVPNELLKAFEELEKNSTDIFGEMTKAGAEVVYQNVKRSMKSSFKTTRSLEKGLKISKVQVTSDGDSIQTWVGFMGYDPSKKTKKYPNGVPIPLIAQAREYGTSSGEQKKPFFRKSFNKSQIEQEMLKVQDKYLPGE